MGCTWCLIDVDIVVGRCRVDDRIEWIGSCDESYGNFMLALPTTKRCAHALRLGNAALRLP